MQSLLSVMVTVGHTAREACTSGLTPCPFYDYLGSLYCNNNASAFT